MKIVAQSKAISTVATSLGFLWVLVFVGAQVRANFLFTSYQTMGPLGFVSDAAYLSTLGLAFLIILSSWKSIGFSDSEIEVRWLYWKKTYLINDLGWIASGPGWIRGTTTRGKKFGFSFFLPRSRFEQKAASDLAEISKGTIERKQEEYWSDPNRTEKVPGVYGRVMPWVASLLAVFLLLFEATIWNSSIAFLDGVVVSSIILAACMVGGFIGLSATGWLRAVTLSRSSIVIARGFRTLEVSVDQIDRESIDRKDLTFTLLNGNVVTLQGLNLVDTQKVAMYLGSI